MHTHPHTHPHDHPHDPSNHHSADEARSQPVVLELGDGVGALIVYTDPDLLGTEVEISPSGEDTVRSHKDVLERVTAAGSAHVLVYDSLPEGTYTLWIDNLARARGVEVVGGFVAELDWRGASSPLRREAAPASARA